MPRPDDLASAAHSTALVARLGRLLGIAFAICFLTGLLSWNAKRPDGWLLLAAPSWGYRVSQGVHVAAGLCCLPLLMAKVYSAYPLFFARPGSAPAGPRRISAVVGFLGEKGLTAILVGAGIMQVSTGLFNIFQWYAFGFDFVSIHFALAWISIGAIVIHVAIKLPKIKQTLRRRGPASDIDSDATGERPRRSFLFAAVGAAIGLTALTVGQSFTPLDRIALLAPRRPRSRNLQGVPVNRTAEQARVLDRLADWRLTLVGPGGSRTIDREQLAELPQVEVRLPIACVEGWSVSATWSGVRVRDLIGLISAGGSDVRVTSMERGSAYAVTRLPAAFADHPDTVLATMINGEPLHPDHGYPARIIAPNRPGELQTKWVERLEVLR
ncbi:Oxidoreductase molybdopterin binding domain-containing protein [Microlunatus soli]|uniref:Oxidoreductase molybdopterin binding domain-containing protein n=1 Tax=Microlunatus soli TaxID=630515 RepID=A0A1H1RY32_9ACTN|nr:Oxidoreductase molybdopterin binding domain-containing protein [Microlunatus soli]